MPLSDKWSRSSLRSAARRELQDATSRWWTDTELNNYLSDWQSALQAEFEFVWGSSTVVTSTATLTLTGLATTILRPAAVYWNSLRLTPTTPQELDILTRDWRASTETTPRAVYQDSPDTISFWPAPSVAGTVIVEYPKTLSFGTDTSTHEVPAWTRYSAVPFVCWRALQRPGANFDIQKALRRKAQWVRAKNRIRSQHASFLPESYPTLRPATRYEADILNPRTPLQP